MYVFMCFYIISVTTTVLIHTALIPCDSSTDVSGQSHLCVAAKAGDASWKTAVMPTTVIRTGIPCSNGVTVAIGSVRSVFVKAQSKISSYTIARCWYDTIVCCAVVHNLGWVE